MIFHLFICLFYIYILDSILFYFIQSSFIYFLFIDFCMPLKISKTQLIQTHQDLMKKSDFSEEILQYYRFTDTDSWSNAGSDIQTFISDQIC